VGFSAAFSAIAGSGSGTGGASAALAPLPRFVPAVFAGASSGAGGGAWVDFRILVFFEEDVAVLEETASAFEDTFS
jgi:hypothetical protein